MIGQAIETPYQTFFDNNGKTLEDGYIYIGESGLNPEVFPISVFWDKDYLYPAAQPIRTINGLPSRDGSPSAMYTKSQDYSILVQDKNHVFIYSALAFSGIANEYLNPVDTIAALRLIDIDFVADGQTIDVKGYYAIGDGGGGQYYWDAASTTTDNGGSIIQSTGVVTGRWKLTVSNIIDIRQFGCKDDDTEDNGPYLNFINTDANISEMVVPNVGVFRTTTEVIFTRDIIISGGGTINAVGCSFSINGSLTAKGNISAAATKGDISATITDVTNLVPGSLLILQNQVDYSFSAHNANYYDGEFAEVLSIAGSVVTFTAPLETSYAGVATDKVFLVDSIKPIISNVEFTGDTAYTLKLFATRDANLLDAECEGGAYGAFSIQKSYNTMLQSGRFYHDEAAVGLNYGIAILNCQYVNIYSVDAYGTRHGITVGGDAADGSVPNRYVKIHNSTISSDGTLYCSDFHGNTADSGYYNCNSGSNVGLAGKNTEYVGGTVIGRTANAPLGYQELVGGFCRFKDVKVTFASSSTAIRVLGNLGSTLTDDIDEDFLVDMEGVEVESTSDITQIMNAFNNAGATIENAWRINNLKVTGDVSNLATIVVATISGTGKRPYRIHVDNIDMDISSLTNWMTKSGVFTGCKATMPTVQFRGTFVIGAGSNFSTGQTYTFPTYPDIPETNTDTTGLVADATGDFAATALVAASTTTTIRPATVTTTGANATANMTTDVIATVKMDNYTLL